MAHQSHQQDSDPQLLRRVQQDLEPASTALPLSVDAATEVKRRIAEISNERRVKEQEIRRLIKEITDKRAEKVRLSERKHNTERFGSESESKILHADFNRIVIRVQEDEHTLHETAKYIQKLDREEFFLRVRLLSGTLQRNGRIHQVKSIQAFEARLTESLISSSPSQLQRNLSILPFPQLPSSDDLSHQESILWDTLKGMVSDSRIVLENQTTLQDDMNSIKENHGLSSHTRNILQKAINFRFMFHQAFISRSTSNIKTFYERYFEIASLCESVRFIISFRQWKDRPLTPNINQVAGELMQRNGTITRLLRDMNLRQQQLRTKLNELRNMIEKPTPLSLLQDLNERINNFLNSRNDQIRALRQLNLVQMSGGSNDDHMEDLRDAIKAIYEVEFDQRLITELEPYRNYEFDDPPRIVDEFP